MRAFFRKKLLEQYEEPETTDNTYLPPGVWEISWQCFQPSVYEGDEFNLVICTSLGVARVRSIDFDFENDEQRK